MAVDVQNPLDDQRRGWDRSEFGDGQFESGFFGAGKDAWHGLGTVIPQDVVKAEEALDLAGLNWEVVRKPLYIPSSDPIVSLESNEPTAQLVEDFVANVRSTDNSVLGVVGSRYQIVQNKEAFRFVDDLVDSSEAKYHTAGSLRKGRQVWLLAKLPQTVKIAGWEDEAIEPFLLFSNTHDGSGAISVAVTPVRVVCKNTLTLALKGAKQRWSARHTSNVNGRLHEARQTIQLAFTYLEELEKVGNSLVSQKLNAFSFDKFLEQLVPLKAEGPVIDVTDRVKRNVEEQREAIAGIFKNADNLANVRGTKWAALQATIEYVDHVRPIRSKENVSERAFIRSVEDSTKLKNRAFALLG